MKVVQVLYSGLGGHGSVALSLAGTASATGAWDCAMVFMGIEETLPAYRHACAANGYRHLDIRTRPGQAWRSWPSFYRALDALAPEVIVLHSVKAILPAALYAWRRSIPLVAVEHQPNNIKRKSEWWVSWWLQQLADAVVVLTGEYRATLASVLGRGFRPGKVHLIPNGIDVDVFVAGQGASCSGAPLIGMAARMTTMKRQDLLIDALAMLRQSGVDWRLSLAGDGEELGGLRARAVAAGLGDAVEFTGYLDEPGLVRWFRTLDVYAHASDGETLSTSLLQALAMGLPIVGSAVPGIENLLARGNGVGIAVEQTPEAFAAAFRRLRDDPLEAAGLRVRARQLAETEYSMQAMFARYDRVVASLCQG